MNEVSRRDLPFVRLEMATPCIEGRPGDARGYVGRGHGQYAHRDSWEAVHGPIPVGMQIDHLCHNRTCVNPDHLEIVTQAENSRRAFALVNVCANGHAYDDANTYIRPSNGWRGCRRCHREIWESTKGDWLRLRCLVGYE